MEFLLSQEVLDYPLDPSSGIVLKMVANMLKVGIPYRHQNSKILRLKLTLWYLMTAITLADFEQVSCT